MPGLTPTYDANGNLTHDGYHTYSWDAEGRPVSIDTVTVTYDALGRAVEHSSVATLYDPMGIKLALMMGQTLSEARVRLPAGAKAVYFPSLSAYWHPDWLGSERLRSSPSRTLIFDTAYAPYGEIYASQQSGAEPSFTGQYQDVAVDMFDFPFRTYHPTQGRWISPDPKSGNVLNPQSWNRYAYVLNKPTTLIDPLGLNGCGRASNRLQCEQGSYHNPFGSPADPLCLIDGVEVPCSIAFAKAQTAGFVECPGDICEGTNWNGLPVQYQAPEGARSGFYTCTLPGEYGSQNAAGEAAVGCINAGSIATNTEFGGNIYQMANGQYSFTHPVAGGPASVDIPDTVPNGTTIAADYHTHAAYDPAMGLGNEIFSPVDIAGNDASGLPGFLGTPTGRIQIYDPTQTNQYPRGCVLVGTPVPISPAVPTCH